MYEYTATAAATNNIDTLISFTDAESLLLTGIDLNTPQTLKSFDEHFEVQLPLADLSYDYASAEYKSYAKEMRQFYFGNKSVDSNTLRDYVKLLSDTFFIYGVQQMVKTQVKNSSGKTFLFKYVHPDRCVTSCLS